MSWYNDTVIHVTIFTTQHYASVAYAVKLLL